jgi:hypothetical protein
MRQLTFTVLIICMLSGPCPPAQAATCQVPSGSYQSIQSAIDDPACTEIVLAAQVFVESPVIERDLTMDGAGSTETFIEGQVQVSGGPVVIQELQISAPPGAATEALWAHSGAQLSGFDLVVINGRWVALFADGFESGDTSAWSSVSP